MSVYYWDYVRIVNDATSIRTEGMVSSEWEYAFRVDNSIAVDFRAHDRAVTCNISTQWLSSTKLRKGQRLDIRYNPIDPEFYCVEQSMYPLSYTRPLVWGVLGVISGVVMLLGFTRPVELSQEDLRLDPDRDLPWNNPG